MSGINNMEFYSFVPRNRINLFQRLNPDLFFTSLKKIWILWKEKYRILSQGNELKLPACFEPSGYLYLSLLLYLQKQDQTLKVKKIDRFYLKKDLSCSSSEGSERIFSHSESVNWRRIRRKNSSVRSTRLR